MTRALRPYALHLALLTALFAFLYGPTLRWLANAWLTNEYYGHGFLVAPLALFLMWRERHRVAAAPLAAARWQNLWGVLLAVAVYAVGFRLRDPFWFSVSLILAIGGVAVYLLGWQKAKHLALPTAFLILAVPLPNLLFIGLELQKLATWGTERTLALFNVDFVRDDFTIAAGGLRFEVAPLCSGLSSVISIITLSTLIAAVSPLSGWARAVLVVSGVPLALAVNVLRITLTIWIGITWGPEASQGFFHGASSLILFLVVLGMVIGLRSALQRVGGREVVASG